MRIVGGKYRGRVLYGFSGNDIRPTSDKARESFFNIIRDRIYGASFLDLCAGTGAMGIEAISRGAAKVVFNDTERKSVALIKGNLEKLKVEEEYKISCCDALRFLKNSTEKYDVIYIDPPYKSGIYESLLCASIDCLKEEGIVVIEGEQPFNETVENLVKTDERKYGRTHLTFFRKEERI